jgi:pimeloyl-ACP methyl ester carboxylesterase
MEANAENIDTDFRDAQQLGNALLDKSNEMRSVDPQSATLTGWNAIMRQLRNTTRRTVLGGMIVGAGALGFVSALAHSPPTKKVFVLVHGAWHGGWCWRRVSDLLQQKGHRVFCPTMTGLGERSHLLTKDINISTHITDICNVLKWEDLQDVVLVGHSYGGIIISGVAEQSADRLASMVFLDAFMPDNGEALIDKMPPAMAARIKEAAARGEISLSPPPSAVFGIGEKDRAWVDSEMTPQPFGSFTEKASYAGARDKIAKKSYIRAKEYTNPIFDANLAKVESDPSWKSFELQTGHDAMIIVPEQLTQILVAVS